MAQVKKQLGRPTGVPIYAGAWFGHLQIMRRTPTKEGARWRVKCHGRLADGTVCGKEFLTKSQYLTRKPNPQTNCGCQTYINANPYKYEKTCWQTMHLRCEYEGHVSYKDYGGRGIKIDPQWSKHHPDGPEVGWQNFLRDVGPCPNPHVDTIDRIESDGHYTKSNVRWADKATQSTNQRRNKPIETRGIVLRPPWEQN